MNNSGLKTLLPQKKLLAFLRGFFVFVVFCGVFLPALASAAWGFNPLKAIFDVFREDMIEETATVFTEPISAGENTANFIFLALPVSAGFPASSPKDDPASGPGLSIVQGSALASHFNSQGILSDDLKSEITTYTVKEGDNLTAIAHSFGVTVNTILWANDIRNTRLIKPGDTLVILPVSGVQYIVKKGDTIESIAKKFNGSSYEITQFNGFGIGEKLAIGSEVIIPDGEVQEILTPSMPAPRLSVSRFASLPELIGYYLRPIIGGRNARVTKANPHGLHGYNGVDLANTCGLPVMASAEGTVLIARSSGWNGGYGRYAVISHENGTQTLYAHMRTVYVSVGQHIFQAQTVGTIGSSGNSTGCHVHFEIRGAKNPF
ncbi:MAG: peptidoglycan DD-metalloendopeptidase family protein [Patescibacteria group bacterium]